MVETKKDELQHRQPPTRYTRRKKEANIYFYSWNRPNISLTPPMRLTRPASVHAGQYHASLSVWCCAASWLSHPGGMTHLMWKTRGHSSQQMISPDLAQRLPTEHSRAERSSK